MFKLGLFAALDLLCLPLESLDALELAFDCLLLMLLSRSSRSVTPGPFTSLRSCWRLTWFYLSTLIGSLLSVAELFMLLIIDGFKD